MTVVRVLVTRPAHQSLGLMNKVRVAGWQPTCVPAMTIEPLMLEPTDKQKILDLDRYDIVICVSANAAELAMEWVSQYWPQMPVGQTWFAVGPASAEVLSSWHLQPRYPAQGDDSEGLLALPELQAVEGQRVLIARGKGGRETLAKTLRVRGATVDYLELYERSLPEASRLPLQAWLQGISNHPDQLHIVAVSSGDGLRNLIRLAGDQAAQLQRVPLVVVSERLAEFAREQGFSAPWVARSAADDAVVSCIEDHFNGSHYDRQ